MKRILALALLLCMLFSLCPAALAADWTLPEGTPMYSPYVMDLDFGTLTILDVGFAKKVQSGLTHGKENNPRYFSAKDGFALFAVKGILHNTSTQSVALGPIQPKISYGPGNKWIGLYGYPIVPLGTPEASTLAPGADVEIVFAADAPNAMYFGGMDLLMEVGGGTLGFRREDVKNLVSIGFTDTDGAPAGDITAMTDTEQPAPAPTEKEDPDMDYLTLSSPKIVPAEDEQGMYRLDFVFSFLYPEKSGENYPTYVDIHYSLLDADQVAVKSTYLQANNLYHGSKVRASACQFFDSSDGLITPEEYAQIKYVRFTGCQIIIPKEDGYHVNVVEQTFKNTEIFPLDSAAPAQPPQESAAPDYTEADIEAALMGAWIPYGAPEGSSFLFVDGKFFAIVSGMEMAGTYTVNLPESTIDVRIQGNDGALKMRLAFAYEDGVLTLMNDDGNAFTKK